MAGAVLAACLVGATCDNPNVFGPLTNRRISILVLNETPYRAIFTLGAYENLNENSVPEFVSFRLESAQSSAEETGTNGFQTETCRRAISLGGQQLLNLIDKNRRNFEDEGTTFDDEAMVAGVKFSDAPIGDPDEAVATVGTAEPITILNGIDYPCGSIVVFRLFEDADAPGGFRAAFEGTIN